MSKIIAIGNALVDILTLLENDQVLENLQLPKGSMQLVSFEESEKVLKNTEGLNRHMASGGSAANTIRALAKLGATTGYVGKVGNDDIGKFFADDIKKIGVFTKLINSDLPSGRAIALVSKDSERTFATYLGAASQMTPDEINELTFAGYDILHIEGYLVFNQYLIEKAMEMAFKNGLTISLDLASYNVVQENLDFLKYLIDRYVNIVFANEEESYAFTGKEPDKAIEMISAMCDIAVVKLGAEGSMVKKGDKKYKVDAMKAKPIDTTGAGDYYAAGFLYGLINNKPLDVSAKYGSVLAGKVIEVVGTSLSDNKWEEIKQIIKTI